MVALRESLVTPEEYLERKRIAETKSEYIAGEIVAMADGSPRHRLIGANVTAGQHAGLHGKSCRVATSDLRIGVPETGLYAYPDVIVACGDLRDDRFDNDTAVNPAVVIEALSPILTAPKRAGKV